MPQPAPSKNNDRRRKPGKALESVARQIKDSDEFVTHVAGIADRYRREHELETGSRGRDVRQSLQSFSKHAAALREWLRQAHKANRSAPECDALGKLGSASDLVRVRSHEMQSWLTHAAQAAEHCLANGARSTRDADRNAPRIAAEGVRATFEHHRLKFSTRLGRESQSDAVRLLCAIAKNAGDAELTPQAAKDALVASGRKQPA